METKIPIAQEVSSYIDEGNIIVTSAPGNGTTSLCLYLCNYYSQSKSILYYNPSANIDRRFVKNYKNTYANVNFVTSPLDLLVKYLLENASIYDILIFDPGDMLLATPKLLHAFCRIIGPIRLICTSQIRVDPTKGGQVYSTVERKQEKFKYSLWIRDVTEVDTIFEKRYLDVFPEFRSGNNFIQRYLLVSNNNGIILN